MTQLALLDDDARAAPEPVGDTDDRFTPRHLIVRLHAEFSFTVDAASHPASPAARVIGRHWTIDDDAAQQDWSNERVFLNPPFSTLPGWVELVTRWNERGCPLVCCLMPANRTEQPFWQESIEPFRDRRLSVRRIETRFLAGRTRYGNPQDPEGALSGSPEFASCLVIWRR